MTSFKSKYYPRSSSKWLVYQEYAMRFYAFFMLVIMLGVLVKIYLGEGILWFSMIGTVVSLGLGNILAYAKLKRDIAEIFFLDKHFAIISVYEILFGRKQQVFPLMYANAVMGQEEIVLHYNDQVLQLHKEDWEDFDLIWNWLSNR